MKPFKYQNKYSSNLQSVINITTLYKNRFYVIQQHAQLITNHHTINLALMPLLRNLKECHIHNEKK